MARLCSTLLIALLLFAPGLAAGKKPVIRVGTSGDYAPFSLALEGEAIVFEGFDLAVARAFAEAHGYELVAKRFRWSNLSRSLEAGQFDVAMSGVTIIPDRSAIGRFSIPVVETGAVVLVQTLEAEPNLESLNRPMVRIGVNAGGYLERVARSRFPKATLLAIPDNAAVLDALATGNVKAVVTDTAEASLWLDASGGATQLGPITRDRKAYLVRADRPDLAAQLDRWLLAREADGTLAAVRELYLGAHAGPAVATPLHALLAAVDERLSLMPMVAVSKREAGLPLVVPRREAIVLDAAVVAVTDAMAVADAAGAADAVGGAKAVDAADAVNGADAAAGAVVVAPAEPLVRTFFRAQIEASKQVQWTALKDPGFERPKDPPDVADVLRPALMRIGEKIARLIIVLPSGLDPREVRTAAHDQLRTPYLSEASRNSIADAISALSGGVADQ
jgi:cyclohexadienyl dehydratase